MSSQTSASALIVMKVTICNIIDLRLQSVPDISSFSFVLAVNVMYQSCVCCFFFQREECVTLLALLA